MEHSARCSGAPKEIFLKMENAGGFFAEGNCGDYEPPEQQQQVILRMEDEDKCTQEPGQLNKIVLKMEDPATCFSDELNGSSQLGQPENILLKAEGNSGDSWGSEEVLLETEDSSAPRSDAEIGQPENILLKAEGNSDSWGSEEVLLETEDSAPHSDAENYSSENILKAEGNGDSWGSDEVLLETEDSSAPGSDAEIGQPENIRLKFEGNGGDSWGSEEVLIETEDSAPGSDAENCSSENILKAEGNGGDSWGSEEVLLETEDSAPLSDTENCSSETDEPGGILQLIDNLEAIVDSLG
jgi:hypothetical protein